MPWLLDRAGGGPRTATGTVTAVPRDIRTARASVPSPSPHVLPPVCPAAAGVPGVLGHGPPASCRKVYVRQAAVFLWVPACPRGAGPQACAWTRQPASVLSAVLSADAHSGLWAGRPVSPARCSAQLAPPGLRGLLRCHSFKECRCFPARRRPRLSLVPRSSWHALGSVTCRLLSLPPEDAVPHDRGELVCFLVQR